MHIYIIGNVSGYFKLVETLVTQKLSVTMATSLSEVPVRSFLLVLLDKSQNNLLKELNGSPITWIAWCQGDPSLIDEAYKAGAMAVFPPETELTFFNDFIIRQLERSNPISKTERSRWPITVQRHIKKGDLILLEDDCVLDIDEGIIAKKMIHRDGCEVLLGLYGKDSMILPHPSDDCYIQLAAHSDCVVRVQILDNRKQSQDFTDQLRVNLQRTEAWAAMQARPHLDLRVLGILSLLADEFGETTPKGRLLNLRLTHAQLASATGSTRATITRTISDLKRLGKLTILPTDDGERYCLLTWDSCAHHTTTSINEGVN